MGRYYFDSSALVKRYHQEHRSADVETLFNEPDGRFLISRLALVEVYSSFARLVRERILNESDFSKLIARLAGDVAAGLLLVVAVSSRRLDDAAKILATHGLKNNVRTLDAIHLATAQALNGRTRLAGFVAADKKLLQAANVSGLSVIDVS
jgi:predicted nucleic acid-binding protein